jgi:hypothetical protein
MSHRNLVREGMSTQQVRELLGPPDQIHENRYERDGVAYRAVDWVYPEFEMKTTFECLFVAPLDEALRLVSWDM